MSAHYNLITDGVEACAAGMKLRLMRGYDRVSIFVRDNGDLLTQRANDDRRSKPLPAEMLVGTYNHRAKQSDIADDLECRLQELLAESAI